MIFLSLPLLQIHITLHQSSLLLLQFQKMKQFSSVSRQLFHPCPSFDSSCSSRILFHDHLFLYPHLHSLLLSRTHFFFHLETNTSPILRSVQTSSTLFFSLAPKVGHIHILCFIISHSLPNPLHSGFCQHCSTNIVLRLSVPCQLYFLCNLLVFMLMVHILSTLFP